LLWDRSSYGHGARGFSEVSVDRRECPDHVSSPAEKASHDYTPDANREGDPVGESSSSPAKALAAIWIRPLGAVGLDGYPDSDSDTSDPHDHAEDVKEAPELVCTTDHGFICHGLTSAVVGPF